MEKPLRICIIGGGAGGLGALKIFKDMPEYRTGKWEIVVFEARNNLGGVWYGHVLPTIPVKIISNYIERTGFLLLPKAIHRIRPCIMHSRQICPIP